MQSSLRGIIFNDDSIAGGASMGNMGGGNGLGSRRDTINLGIALGNNTSALNEYNMSGKPKENTYTKM